MVHSDEPMRQALETLIGGMLDQARHVVMDGTFYDQIAPLVEQETTAIKSVNDLLHELHRPDANRLLDFGCGAGHHRPKLEGMGYHWTGVDYIDAVADGARPAVLNNLERVILYDGRRIPLESSQFDVVYSVLVFEHIQDIRLTFQEIGRVLRPGGSLIGHVAYMEPFHDFSTYNFTPLGMKLAAEAGGLEVVRIYPDIDVFSFLFRKLHLVMTGGATTPFDPMMLPNGFFHQKLEAAADRLGLDVVRKNLLHLWFSVHFCFHLRKPIQ
jgi:SAM-dependent methyltransferase